MTPMHYKGYEVTAEPYPHEDGSWQVNFDIAKHQNREKICRNFELPMRFFSREEAVNWCHQAGRELIDSASLRVMVRTRRRISFFSDLSLRSE